MQWAGLNEIREKYLSSFELKGHLRLKNFSLASSGDSSLLLISSGMAPMKEYFVGEVISLRKRMTTCQKCTRTFNIERAGTTTRHGTYFEMLGNSSFGDCFKHGATVRAWELRTKVMVLLKNRAWAAICQDNDKVFEIWTKEVGVSPDRIVYLGKEDNSWGHDSGPYSLYSELYLDRDEQHGCGSPIHGPGCGCDHHVEFWNLAFTQSDSDGKDTYTPLNHPNTDTGTGLERLACVTQSADNLLLVGTVQNIVKHVNRIADTRYGDDSKNNISLCVTTDHIHSTALMTGSGVMSSNEGRGYMLRRLLRCAARHDKLIGVNRPFLPEVTEIVIVENKNAYPELVGKHDMTAKLIHVEGGSPARMISQGLQLPNHLMQGMEGRVFFDEDVFCLDDTYGSSPDLMKEIVTKQGMIIDEEVFRRLVTEQK